MPWTADYLPDGAYVRFSGDMTGGDLVEANADFYTREYNAGPRFAVFDFSAVEQFHVGREAIDRVVAQDHVAAMAAVRDLVVAVVAPQEFGYALARTWENQLADTPWRTLVARSQPEALAWLSRQGFAARRFGARAD